MGILLAKEDAELLRDTLDVFLFEVMYISEDVAMLVQDECTELRTFAWNEEYLLVHMQDDYNDYAMGILLSKEDAELLRDTLDVFLFEVMYTSEDVEMLVQDKHTALSTCAWKEYLHVRMQDDYNVMGILLSKENAELIRDTLDVFLEGGYSDE